VDGSLEQQLEPGQVGLPEAAKGAEVRRLIAGNSLVGQVLFQKPLDPSAGMNATHVRKDQYNGHHDGMVCRSSTFRLDPFKDGIILG
jgi:hypothetical protein